MFNFYIVKCIAILLYVQSCLSIIPKSDKSLSCKMIWKETNTGETLPAHSISVSNKIDDVVRVTYIARANFGEEFYSIGTYDPTEDKAVFANYDIDEYPSSLTSFEVLTNPYNCIYSWKQVPNKKFVVPIASSIPTFFAAVGKVQTEEDKWQFGTIYLNTGSISTAVDPCYGMEEFSENYFYLESYVEGLTLEIYDIEFENDLFAGDLDVIGEDEIINNGNTFVNQSLSHRKMVRETTNFTVSETWTSTYTETIKTRKWFKTKVETTTTTVSHTEITSLISVKQTDVTVTKEIIVPPYISVRACSVITMKNDFVTDYTAKAKYYGGGISPEEILRILAEDGITGGYIENDYVVIPVEGTFSGSLALSTSFIVVPLDDPDGCFKGVETTTRPTRPTTIVQSTTITEPSSTTTEPDSTTTESSTTTIENTTSESTTETTTNNYSTSGETTASTNATTTEGDSDSGESGEPDYPDYPDLPDLPGLPGLPGWPGGIIVILPGLVGRPGGPNGPGVTNPTTTTEVVTTALTEHVTTALTEHVTTALTEHVTTALTEHVTTAFTGVETTAFTEDETTAFTEDETTAFTEDETTAFTEDETTAFTEDETTVLMENGTTTFKRDETSSIMDIGKTALTEDWATADMEQSRSGTDSSFLTSTSFLLGYLGFLYMLR